MNTKITLKPYLVNAFYTWSMDMEYTPLIEVHPHDTNILPKHLWGQPKVILNIHPSATRNMIFSKEIIQFEAVFQGQAFQVTVAYESIGKIFTKDDPAALDFSSSSGYLGLSLAPYGDLKAIRRKKHLTLIKDGKENQSNEDEPS